MPLRLEKISNYESKKFTVKNISGAPISIGDINIVLRKNESKDLFAQDQFTKKRLRTADQVYNSRDLDLLIVLGKVQIFTENGQVESLDDAINVKRYADNVFEEDVLSNKPISMEYQDLTNPNIVSYTEKFTDLGNVSGAVQIDVSEVVVYKMTITGATNVSFTGWPTRNNTSASCVIYFENAGTDVTFSGATFKYPGGELLTFEETGEDRVTFQSVDNGTTIYASLSGSAFGTPA